MANQRMYLVCRKCFKGNVYDDPAAFYLAKRMAVGYYRPGHDDDLGQWFDSHAYCLDAFEIVYEHEADYDYRPLAANDRR